ncbi:hypothetical protein GIS00_16665 [Nakamurella sp. YIM 132087]|uniref:Antibiotic biosynthesis monooxygenase n=1 Tax=Nakamurella alba TaxID=2665158 RepID=A0A7K1FN25_9ACTN|nr:hypothetical protein [Nakamurella alba]MTD15567.1 hypothetical protein [Nakamurella alba]
MIRSVLTLCGRDGRVEPIEDYYRDHHILDRARAFPGCRNATLLRAVDGGRATHLVMADWDDTEAYGRWVSDPFRQQTSVGLKELLDLEPGAQFVGGLYEILTPDSDPAPSGP